ncbi:hypothetical protein [Thauera sp. SWB20]|uniref:hypothetical protein n=1 Tax=Thauera sp. SWB20 TaxID=1572758 RepID=UPI0005ADB015|nr:hypothetical protein [Thauera sp. SWB20]KIN88317.1 hypothetical protein PO78_225 [Thauera sp. SWB20]
MSDDHKAGSKVREFRAHELDLHELKTKKLGLYISLNRLSSDEMARLSEFLRKIDIEPIALAHSSATDDD